MFRHVISGDQTTNHQRKGRGPRLRTSYQSTRCLSVDEVSLRNDIKNLVGKTVERTLNALLDEEASELVGAGR